MSKQKQISPAVAYIKKNYRIIIVVALAFLAASLLNFFNIATSQTIASFSLSDFEIGQIADRTIISPLTLQGDSENPASVLKGEKIIRKGFEITEEGFEKLRKMAASPIYLDYRAIANNELYLFVLASIWFLLFAFLPFGRKIKMSEVIVQAIFFLLTYAAVSFGRKVSFASLSYTLPMLIPVTLFVILITILYGQLSAIVFAAIASFGVYNAAQWQAFPFLYTIISAIAATAVVRKIERRIDMVIASLLLSIINVACIMLLTVVFNERFSFMLASFAGVAFNGFLSGIIALGLLTPLELLLNTASIFRLMDLSDLNNPTMRKLMLAASGTYSHSMMVAQLAESACREIGADPLIARVGAYYHDIGKIDQSEYFVENQTGVNKHDNINPSLSVAVIKSHLKKGIEKARQLHLPEQVINVIGEHHGNSVISYFYNEAKEKDPSVSVEEFRYQGNPPSTRESAVVMLADTTEAACRTLENPTASRLEKFIQDLFNGKLSQHQLDYCTLTFRDLTKIKEAFVTLLAGYYHNRIEYPNQKDPDADTKKTNEKVNEKSSEKKVSEKLNEKSNEKTNEKKKDA